MKQVKAPLLFKINICLLFFISFLLLIITPKNVFSFWNILFIIFLFSGIILFFYVLKNNSFAIKILPIFLILNFFGFNYNFQLIVSFIETFMGLIFWRTGYLKYEYLSIIIYLLFFIFIVINLYFFNKKINKGVEYLEEKYLTEEKQHKNFIITFSIPILLLILFRFGYYEINDIEIENIDDSFFITKYENLDINKEDNLVEALLDEGIIYDWDNESNVIYNGGKYKNLKEEFVNCLYKDICSLTLENYTNLIDEQLKQDKDIDIDLYIDSNKEISQTEKIKIKSYLNDNIKLLYEFGDENIFDLYLDQIINNWSNKKYYKSNLNDTYIYTNFLKFNRDLKFKILYYLNNNQEENAIKLLKAQLKTSYIILNGDNSILEMSVALFFLESSYETIDIILDNYELNKKSKFELLILLKNEINKSFLDNSLKYNYKASINDFFNYNINKLSFFDLEYFKNGSKEIIFYQIKNNGRLSDNIKNKYNIDNLNFLKNNIFTKIILYLSQSDYSENYTDLFSLEEFRKILINKINNNFIGNIDNKK